MLTGIPEQFRDLPSYQTYLEARHDVMEANVRLERAVLNLLHEAADGSKPKCPTLARKPKRPTLARKPKRPTLAPPRSRLAEGRAILDTTPARVMQLQAMPYEDYLRTDEWAQTRERILDRDAFRCRECRRVRKKSPRLNNAQVHHRHYQRVGREWPEDLETLCRAHHKGRHFCLCGTKLRRVEYLTPARCKGCLDIEDILDDLGL